MIQISKSKPKKISILCTFNIKLVGLFTEMQLTNKLVVFILSSSQLFYRGLNNPGK
jgi:hypothetical protein